MEFEWTQFPHLVIINRLIARGNVIQVSCIKLSEICHVEQRIHGYPPPNPSNMGIRDSSVFFGKVLSTLGSDSSDYRKQEFKLWAKENWHRISMYKKPEEYRGLLAFSLAMEYSGLGTLMHLSKLPIWRIKSMVLIRTLRGLK